MIRAYVPEDFQELEKLILQYNERYLQLPENLYATHHFKNTVNSLMLSTRGLLLIAEEAGKMVGSLAAKAEPSLFFPMLQANLLWWRSVQGVGDKLIDEFDRWHAALGCKLICGCAIGDKGEAYFLNNGYYRAERSFYKYV